jgi:hypothetical protein
MKMIVHKDRFRRPQHAEAGVRLRPVFDDFHLLRMEGRYEYPRHQHTNYEVILVERGPYRCELNGTELALRRIFPHFGQLNEQIHLVNLGLKVLSLT